MYCQKCRTPLKLDSSLEDLNAAAFDLLVGSSSHQAPKKVSSRNSLPRERRQLYDRACKDATSPMFKRQLSSIHHSDAPSSEIPKSGPNPGPNPAMSFVMLTESQVVPPAIIKSPLDNNPKHKHHDDIANMDGGQDEGKAISQDMERASRLFDILSARSDIDHPVCTECTDMLVAGLQHRLESATKERDAYVGYLKQINANIPTDEEIKESRDALAKAKGDEAAAFAELKKLEIEKAKVDEEIAQMEEEARDLDVEENNFWASRNAFADKLTEFQNVRDSVNLKYDHDTQLLEKLQRTNVYNDTFCISHDGKFGTINGLRLGRLSHVPVDWPEINAAWGHTLLLLQTVADRLGYKFHGYDLQPMGSTSRIIKYEILPPIAPRRTDRSPKKQMLELFSSGDMPLGLTFMHRKFDTAMVAFLECMRQLGGFVEEQSSRTSEGGRGIVLPYKIKGDTIGEVSIKLGIAQDDAWSRACKFTLTCCKFLLAHASNVNAANSRRGV